MAELKVSLSMSDRLAIMSLMPKESADVMEQFTVKDLLYKTMISKPQLKELKQDFFGLIEPEDDIEEEFSLTDAEVNLFKEGYSKAKTDKKITLANASLCKKIRDWETPNKKSKDVAKA